jgi:hypothetical protein
MGHDGCPRFTTGAPEMRSATGDASRISYPWFVSAFGLVNGCNVFELNAWAFEGVLLLGSKRSKRAMIPRDIFKEAALWRQTLPWDRKRGIVYRALIPQHSAGMIMLTPRYG